MHKRVIKYLQIRPRTGLCPGGTIFRVLPAHDSRIKPERMNLQRRALPILIFEKKQLYLTLGSFCGINRRQSLIGGEAWA